MAEPLRAAEMLERLHAGGIRLAIDDFGTGYSSLAYLRKLPVSELKIDKSFVLPLASSEEDVAVVRAVLEMAHALGLQVVAEGVEDQRIWDLLSSLGCDTAQGYYMSRPLPGPELLKWLGESPWGTGALPTAALPSQCRGAPEPITGLTSAGPMPSSEAAPRESI